jgi:hypothetical protein
MSLLLEAVALSTASWPTIQVLGSSTGSSRHIQLPANMELTFLHPWHHANSHIGEDQ